MIFPEMRVEVSPGAIKGRVLLFKAEKRAVVHHEDVYKVIFISEVNDTTVNQAINYAKGVIKKVIDKY